MTTTKPVQSIAHSMEKPSKKANIIANYVLKSFQQSKVNYPSILRNPNLSPPSFASSLKTKKDSRPHDKFEKLMAFDVT
jgi:hypothetical protein